MEIEESIGLTGEAPKPEGPKIPKAEEAEEKRKPLTKSEDEKIMMALGDAAINEPVRFEIDVKPYNKAHRLLQRLKVLPAKREFVMHPICLGPLIQISKLLFSIKFNYENQNDYISQSFETIAAHAPTLIEVIAIAIKNRKQAPEKSLKDFLERNLTTREVLTLVLLVISMMQVSHFMKATGLISSCNVLKKTESETSTGPRTKTR